MAVWLVTGAIIALSIERAAYVWVDHYPSQFEQTVRTLPVFRGLGPVNSLLVAFGAFKAIQFGVFASWIAVHGGWCPEGAGSTWAKAAGLAAGVLGQTLNFQVFRLLGTSGVFYGNHFGRATPHCHAFPFSLLPHPQYVGTCLSIWGLFLLVRFPCSDWATLPLIETALYGFTATLERRPAASNV